MDIDNSKIIGHIVGISTYDKDNFMKLIKKSCIYKEIDIIDLNIITEKILNDEKMALLYNKYEELLDDKMKKIKIKDLEKKMNDYWKVKMIYYLRKYININTKKILLIGYISYFKNHKININLDIETKYLVKVNMNDNIKNIIEYNLDNNRDDIINSIFDLNYLDKEYLSKMRINVISIYKKLNYNLISLQNIIKSIELNYYNEKPKILYHCSTINHNKKILISSNDDDYYISTYTEDWLAIVSPYIDDNVTLNIQKGIKDKKKYVKLTKDNINDLNRTLYLYEILDTYNFVPYPSKNNIYKYISSKPIKINRMIEINNVIEHLNNLNIDIIKI